MLQIGAQEIILILAIFFIIIIPVIIGLVIIWRVIKNKKLNPNLKFCPFCTGQIQPQEKICPLCGKDLSV